jgi:peptidoglycan hydrolase-like protein with peptidoglycan-binding domain
MSSNGQFEIITSDELIERLKKHKFKTAQVHHTWRPNEKSFTGKNHIAIQEGMYRFHTKTRGWDDIGQHVTLMPDGLWVTGRPFNSTPAGIKGHNTGAFMAEIVGDFDKGQDKLDGAQLEEALQVYNYLHKSGAEIVFHRDHSSKTCPGTGIDKREFVKQVQEWTEDKRTAPIYVPNPVHEEQPVMVKFGDSGALVKKFQSYLKELGYDIGKYGADGIAGRDTVAAVEKFQKDNKLIVDGIIGKQTSAKFNELLQLKKGATGEGSSIVPFPGYNLKRGMSDRNSKKDIERVQRAIKVQPDGRFGSRTERAVREYQRRHGLSVDGIVGKNTWSVMF